MNARTKSQFKTWQRLPDLSAGDREIRPPSIGAAPRAECARSSRLNQRIRLPAALPGTAGQRGSGTPPTDTAHGTFFLT